VQAWEKVEVAEVLRWEEYEALVAIDLDVGVVHAIVMEG
jgi:hypothetical protein